MKISLNLLKQFGEFDTATSELVSLIASRIGQVESVIDLGEHYKGIVVGVITSAATHPNADKLGLYQVDIGGRIVQVVAGDKTLIANDRVAYLAPGCTVPSSVGEHALVITAKEIRGQTSDGMLASAEELNFGDAHEGVLKLDADAEAGTSLAAVYHLNDTILEVENKVLTHRPDLFGHLGFARELAGISNRSFKSPDWYSQTELSWPEPADPLELSIVIDADEAVPRFSAVAYRGVNVKQSSLQIQTWLTRLGIRPVNNVVDLTNYLMILSAQPLHAFDYDKVIAEAGNGVLTVRYANKDEQLTLLDGKTITPHPQAVVIAGAKGALALGGVMGGQSTEVDMNTKNIILEAANFDMYSIRNTSMAHGISSDAVTRFIRGQNPEQIAPVQAKARELLAEWTGAQTASGFIDIYQSPPKTRSITVDSQRINALLGTNHSADEVADRLRQVELQVEQRGNELTIAVPSWRRDLAITEDIVEEVGRLYGFDTIKAKVPQRSIRPASLTTLQQLVQNSRLTLSAAGATELLTYSGIPQRLLTAADQDPDQAYRVRNALSPDFEHMRMSLTPSLMDKVNLNFRQGWDKLAVFEIGTTQLKSLTLESLPVEQFSLALVYASKVAQPSAAYYYARKYLVHWLGTRGYRYQLLASSPASDDAWLSQVASPFAADRRALIKLDDDVIGVVGEFSARIRRLAKVPAHCAGFELNLKRLDAAPTPPKTCRPLPRFPKVTNDLTLAVSLDHTHETVADALNKALSHDEIKTDVKPLQSYRAPYGQRHLSFRLWFYHDQRTLTQLEVNAYLERVVSVLAEQLGARQI